MDFQQAALTICAAAVAYVWYKRHWACTISDIPGPKNPSWIFGISTSSRSKRSHLIDLGTGHQWWWQLKEALVFEEELLDEYGTIVRWNGALGVRFFLISDAVHSSHLRCHLGTTVVDRRPESYSPHSPGLHSRVRKTTHRQGVARNDY